jgi:3-dehydroquinate dehydratase type I
MKRLWSDKNLGNICIPITETTMEDAVKAVKEASRIADLIELRMDYLKNPEMGWLLHNRRKPFIVTNRRREEGGKYRGNEEERFKVFKEAIELGAEYVDIEAGSERSEIQNLMAGTIGTKIILSLHNFKCTPSIKTLERTFDRMVQRGADLIKIVTFARSWEDNFNIFSLLPHAKERKREIIAFCMGEKGKMSRIFSPLMGGAWTYASLKPDRASAPGQLFVEDIKEIWERLR